ncbi:MAG TPA: hypothetical protein H9870_09200 [Candidatus Corynebacterium avicola]|uniref:Altered inheritance of mitochondria protein 6 n=1 Tax=Candidatus Corynebacterium avicola TaxID=2838527 RepID=A0A9D1RQR6_9CORY|nr:hypothetical protein [Candidatus Corynebacterium avicola]
MTLHRFTTTLGASVLALAIAGTTTAVADPADPADIANSANPAPAGFTTQSPLPQAHAHNDYLHPHPLWDALGQGFTSIEADIFYEDGQLLLGHTQEEATEGPDAGRSLEDYYLKPLAEYVRNNDGQVYPDHTEPVRLLVDVKDGGADTLNRVEEILANYEDVLTHVKDGEVQPGAIQVVYSGEPPFESIADRSTRYGFYDGRPSDIKGDDALDPQDVPLVSASVTDVATDLGGFADDVDEFGAQSRVWGVPETDDTTKLAGWSSQLDAGLDVISTDDLEGLREFLLSSHSS